MATFSERLAYILDFDTKGAVRDVEKFGKSVEKNLGDADKRIDKIGSKMQKFGAGAVAFAGVAGAGLVALASGAAEAEAGMAALEQVVGEAVAHDIQKWAQDSAKNVGLSSRAAIDATTSFAQLGKIIGLDGQELSKFSTDLTTLAADFAAFKNVSPEQALQDIQAGFAGSTEVMRKYGIFLDDATLKSAYFRETGERVTGTLSAQQKIVAINAELYRQGADMLGQWGRESGELAGQQAQLKANLQNLADGIGAGVLPMVSTLVSTLNKGAEAFNALSPAAKSTIGTIAGIGVAVIGVAGALSFVIGKVITARDRFSQLSKALHTADGSLSRMGKVARVAAAGTTALAVATLVMSLRAERAAKHAQQFSDVVEHLARANDEQLESFVPVIKVLGRLRDQKPEETFAKIARENLGAAQKVRDHAAANEEFRAEMEAAGLTVDEMTKILDDEAAAQKRAQEASEAGARAVEQAGQATEQAEKATSSYVQWLEVRGSTEQRVSDLTYERAKADEEAERAVEDLTDAIEESVDAAKEEADAHKEAADAILEATDARRAAQDAQFALNDAQRDYQAAIEEYNETLKDSDATERDRAQALQDTVVAATEVADAQKRVAQELAASTGAELSAAQAGDVWRDSMLQQAAAAQGPLREAILDYIANVEGVPESALTMIEASLAEGDIKRAQQLLDEASATRKSQIEADAETAQADAKLDESAARERLAEILAEAETKAAEEKLEGVRKRERIAELVAEALTKTADRDLQNLSDKQRQAIIDAVAKTGSADAALKALGPYYPSVVGRYERTIGVPSSFGIRVYGIATPGLGLRGAVRSQHGNLFNRPSLTTIAEDGDTEVVLPLDKPRDLQRWLSKPEVAGPIVAALGALGYGGGGGGGAVYNIHQHFPAGTRPAEVMAAIRRYERRNGRRVA